MSASSAAGWQILLGDLALRGQRCALLVAIGSLVKPNSWSLSVRKLDPRTLKSLFDNRQGGSARLSLAGLELSNGDNSNGGSVGQLLLAPIKKCSSSSALCGCEHD
jgi:hypothetical protein